MAFSEEMLERTFPVERSPRDKGFVIDVRIYWNDVGTVLSLNGVPLTGAPGDEGNMREALDTFRRLIERGAPK
jgi:hypothetical protein